MVEKYWQYFFALADGGREETWYCNIAIWHSMLFNIEYEVPTRVLEYTRVPSTSALEYEFIILLVRVHVYYSRSSRSSSR